ncbi:glycosyltransferase family 4 protein [Rhodococcus sp. X156]|uniref:glycosyltransferase family 4 protein n=1 Tax=Rhodococcus sp. X156 TaxID=2499145 RepID=UPI000FDCB357|nr:glycosyltransferase family 4 protein [Rhodococcus sp. X156]
MRILLVSWEYPPVVVGGLGRHVHSLACHLAAAGHDVAVLARRPTGTDAGTHPTTDAVVEGVRVVAVAEDPLDLVFTEDLMAWTLGLNHALVRAGLALQRSGWQPEVVHGHDWLVAHAAVALAEHLQVPLVATLHATEAGRHSGWLPDRMNRQVHSAEWWLANSADSLVTCSAAMRAEVTELFRPEAPVTVLHNGIDLDHWPSPPQVARTGPPQLLFLGRLEWEKGVQDAIAALARVRRTHPGTRLVVAGEGSQLEWLRAEARRHRVLRAVTFAGHLSTTQLLQRLARADAVVLPSRYEPFGIVALEAAAAGAPLVASSAGGLGEAVQHGVTGLSFTPGDVAGLTTAVRSVLDDPGAARERAQRARARLDTDFCWTSIAAATVDVYRAAHRRPRAPLARPVIPPNPLPGR